MLKPLHVFIGIKALGEQLRLNLRQPQPYRRDSFVVSACNAEAAARIDAWPRWTSGALVLAGPAGAGKSHLAQAWAEHAGAKTVRLDEIDPDTRGPLLIEDVGEEPLGEALFHLLNRTTDPQHGLVLTGRARPADWPTALPDLRSRLNALQVVELSQPDDGVLSGALWRLFAERLIRPAPDLIAYLVTRIERSVPAAAAMVERIEAAAATLGRPINRALARDLLARDDEADESDA